MRPAAIEVDRGPPGRPDGDPEPLGQAGRPDLERRHDPDRKGLLAGEQESGPPAQEHRIAGAADLLDELGQVVEVGLLRGVMLLPERQDPILDDARGQLVESPDLLGGQLHPAGDGLDQLVVVHAPAQPGPDHPPDRPGARAGLAADAEIAEPRRRGWRGSRFGRLRPRGTTTAGTRRASGRRVGSRDRAGSARGRARPCDRVLEGSAVALPLTAGSTTVRRGLSKGKPARPAASAPCKPYIGHRAEGISERRIEFPQVPRGMRYPRGRAPSRIGRHDLCLESQGRRRVIPRGSR